MSVFAFFSIFGCSSPDYFSETCLQFYVPNAYDEKIRRAFCFYLFGLLMADAWSCGVTLCVMLVGAYPFEDKEDPRNFRKIIQRIMAINFLTMFTYPKIVDISFLTYLLSILRGYACCL